MLGTPLQNPHNKFSGIVQFKDTHPRYPKTLFWPMAYSGVGAWGATPEPKQYKARFGFRARDERWAPAWFFFKHSRFPGEAGYSQADVPSDSCGQCDDCHIDPRGPQQLFSRGQSSLCTSTPNTPSTRSTSTPSTPVTLVTVPLVTLVTVYP